MSGRPRFSTLVALVLVLVAALLATTAVLLDVWARPRGGKTIVTVRLWDELVAAAYRQSFAAFTRAHPGIEVRTDLVAYSTYFNTLRTDVAAGNADDIFWLSNAYLAGYADSGRLMDIGRTLGPGAASAWKPAVVEQFTRAGVLWGVPQLTDAGTAVYYNADLLAAVGVDPAQLDSLRSPREVSHSHSTPTSGRVSASSSRGQSSRCLVAYRLADTRSLYSPR